MFSKSLLINSAFISATQVSDIAGAKKEMP